MDRRKTTQVAGLEIDKTMSGPHGAAMNQAKFPPKISGGLLHNTTVEPDHVTMVDTQSEKLVSRGVVLSLFAAAYFWPLFFYSFIAFVTGGVFWGLMYAYASLYFPSGLIAFWTSGTGRLPNEDFLKWTALGYLIYGLLLTLLLLFRKRWQFAALSIVLLMLLVINFAGCRIVADRTAGYISAP